MIKRLPKEENHKPFTAAVKEMGSQIGHTQDLGHIVEREPDIICQPQLFGQLERALQCPLGVLAGFVH
jgi:hypothetical protein